MTQRSTQVWLGGYTPDMDGAGEGILSAQIAPDGTLTDVRLAARVDSPSFVAQHPSLPVLYAVGEAAQTLHAFEIGADASLAPLGAAAPAGAAACHVAVDPAGRFAVVACWASGQVLVYALDAASGAIVGRTEAAPASDPYAGVPETELVAPHPDSAPRQSRAHFAQFLADGRVMTIDLGFDLARVWRFSEADAALELDHEVVFPYGTGPRHIAPSQTGRLYVDGEYAIDVTVLEPGADGRYRVVSAAPVRTVGRQAGESAAHLVLNADESLLYVGVRGSNVIATMSVAADGSLAPLAETPSGTGAAFPRHHHVTATHLYVANQLGGDIAVFALGADGVPGEAVQSLPAGSPTAVVPAL
ncbi:MAG: lactonase family protein [Microbacteriaceae bacterium]|nr:lactonase family protein [Microbacteriaceae bacterium]MCL2793759.1 lactonase family protein [Microbacteriaceae bacterium]